MERLRGLHEYYTQTPRHWSSHSEKYTGADSLLSALDQGWKLYRRVYRQEFILRGGRYTQVFFFELYKDDAIATMAVVDTPIVLRLIARYQLQIIVAHSQVEDETVEAPAVKSTVKAMASFAVR